MTVRTRMRQNCFEQARACHRPGDIPVQAPNKCDLVINLKTVSDTECVHSNVHLEARQPTE